MTCGCPCPACEEYCEQCPAACAGGHTYTDRCRLDDPHAMDTADAQAVSDALADPGRPTRTPPPRGCSCSVNEPDPCTYCAGWCTHRTTTEKENDGRTGLFAAFWRWIERRANTIGEP